MLKRKLITTTAAAEILSVSEDKIRQLVRDGRLEAIDVSPGKRRPMYRIYEDSLDSLAHSLRVAPVLRTPPSHRPGALPPGVHRFV